VKPREQTQLLNIIVKFVEREIQLISALLKILRQEYAAMANNDLPAIETQVNIKQELVKNIQENEQNFAAQMENTGIRLDQQGIDAALEGVDPREKQKVISFWDELRDLAEQCQRQNEINGRVLEINKINTQRLLNILRGQMPETQTTYGPSGKTNSKSESKSLVQV
jgi:flagella synthesis protein FlgN